MQNTTDLANIVYLANMSVKHLRANISYSDPMNTFSEQYGPSFVLSITLHSPYLVKIYTRCDI